MKSKYALLVLGFITSVITGVVLSHPASAAIDPSSVQIVDNLKITQTVQCDEQNWTTDWINVISSPDGNGVNNGIRYYWDSPSLQDQIEQAWANRKYSGVSQVFAAGSATQRTGFLIWFQTSDPKPVATYDDYGFTALLTNIGVDEGGNITNTGYYLYAFQDTETCDMHIYNAGAAGGFAIMIGQNSTTYPREAPYYANLDVQYPPGYTGQQIPGSDPANQPDKEIRRPNFVYQLNNKSVSATPYAPEPDLPDFSSELDEGYYFEGYYMGWNLWKCPGDFDELTGVCSSTLTLIDDQLLPVDANYKFDVTEYGNYQIEAEYWAQSCYRYPSYPTTPDYCFYSKLRAHFTSSDFDYVNTFRNIAIDGHSEVGDTKDLDCTEGGYCTTPVVNCSGIDNFVDKLNCQLSGQLSVGLLNPSLTAVKKLINGVVVPSSPTCTIPLQNITVVGHVIPISSAGPKMCSAAQQVRQGFPIVPIVVNAIFALSILAFIIHRINKLLDNDQHDVLEKV